MCVCVGVEGGWLGEEWGEWGVGWVLKRGDGGGVTDSKRKKKRKQKRSLDRRVQQNAV